LFQFLIQICDFGLAKWLPDQLSHHTVTCFEGTFGSVITTFLQSGTQYLLSTLSDILSYIYSYLAPEYLTHGVVDEKTDVFAFGVLLLELISGRKALDSSQHSLLMWVCVSFFPTSSSDMRHTELNICHTFNSRQSH